MNTKAPDGRDLFWCDVRDTDAGQSYHLCIPQFVEVAGWFKGVQRAVNAWRRKKSKSPISVDGKIGPVTVSAVNEIRKTERIGPDLNAPQVAALAVQVATEIAEKIGAQTNFDPQPKSTPQESPTTVPPETLEKLRDREQKKSNLKWWILGGLAVVAAGAGAYYWYRKSKGQPLFGGGAGMELDDGDDDYDDEPPPEFGNVIDV